MSNPAIVLMTDPSRCNLGDVHHLVEALLEIQQMGQDAIPQAFCDHPAAASEFVDAYAHAYPQLVLEDREIPTPGHLHSLIATGQIGALGRLPELALPDEVQRPFEQNGTSAFPIVVLTLGSSQVLLDALRQSPSMRETVRLIDVRQDGTDAAPVSIADAVAIRGLDGEPSEHDQSDTERRELDDVAGASKKDPTSLALHDDQMNLDVVETADVVRADPSEYEQDAEPEPGPVAPSAAVVQPPPVVVAEPVAELALPEGSPGGAAVAEAVLETAPQPVAAWPTNTEVIEPITPPVEPEAQPADDSANASDGQDEQPASEGAADDRDLPEHDDVPEDDDVAEHGDAPDKKEDVVGKAARARDEDEDVYYPAVGSLIAGADVLYPAVDHDEEHGTLRELAAVLLDDGILDLDLASEFLAAHRDEGLPAPARQEALLTFRSSDNVVTIEDLQGAFDQDSDDALDDSSAARLLQDSDL
jgi:hypothetical protein